MNPITPFPTTHWSIVLAIAPKGGEARDPGAIEKFLKTYWGPVESFIESMRVPREDAEDLTQEIFAAIHRLDQYAKLHPDKGRMRGYLKTSAKHRVFEFHRKQSAKKRGGNSSHLSLEEDLLPSDLRGPEREFDKRWALRLLDLTAAQMERDYAARNRLDFFHALFPVITLEETDLSYAKIAAQLESSEGAVKVASHRMRQKYQKTLREEVAKTVVSENEIDGELAALFNALSRS